MELRFSKTDAGVAETRSPSLAIPLASRHLLALVDRASSIDHWLGCVADARLKDAVVLLTHGLIETVLCQPPQGCTDESAIRWVIDAMLALDADRLYLLLTEQSKLRLGLIHGFRMILALERCANQDERQALAIRFVLEVWRGRGAAGLEPLRRRLAV